jgi:curved DNA-binding protein CbpA
MQGDIVSYIGDFNEFSFGELLYSLGRQKETGVLYLRHDRVIKRLYLHGGELVYTESSLAREGLLRQAVDEGLVDRKELIGRAESNGHFATLAEWLIGEAGISPSDLADLFAKILRRRIEEIFLWPEGEYLFVFDEEPPEYAKPWCTSAPVEEIIFSGIMTHYHLERSKALIREIKNSLPILLVEPASLRERLNLNSRQINFLRSFDGKTEIMDLAFVSPLSVEESLALVLFLKTTGLLDFASEIIEVKKGAGQLNDEDLEIARRVEKDAPTMLQKGPFQLLQVNRLSFTDEDVRRGYYTLAQRYHKAGLHELLPPDVADLSKKLFEKASVYFEALIRWIKAQQAGRFQSFISMADDLLSDENQLRKAELTFLAGMAEYKSSRAEQALKLFKKASGLRESENEYMMYAALTELQLDPGNKANIRNILTTYQRCVNLDKNFPDPYLVIGRCFELLGQVENAYDSYLTARTMAPEREDIRKAFLRSFVKYRTSEKLNRLENAADKERLQNLAKWVEDHEKCNLYEILRVGIDSDRNEVRKAYFSLAKELHPDTLGQLKNHPIAERAFVMINEAYDVLSSHSKRRSYDRSLHAVETHKQYEEMEKKKHSQHQLQKATGLVKEANYTEAIGILTELLNEDADFMEAKVQLVWAVFNRDFKTDAGARRIAEDKLTDLASIYPKSQEPFLYLGKIALRSEDLKKALLFFQKAHVLAPDSVEANREIRLLQQRITMQAAQQAESKTAKATAEQPQEKKSILGGFFGKKKN